MKLSELVAYKNELDQLSAWHIFNSANNDLQKITHLVQTCNIQLNDTVTDIVNQYNQVVGAVDQFEDSLNKLKCRVDEEIAQAEKPWFQESYRLYEGELEKSADVILKLRANHDDLTVFKSRLARYVDWQHAGIIIRPGNGSFVDDMVGLDPLYLIDIEHDYLKPTVEKFTKVYQRRLRQYVVTEDINSEILWRLPDNQFGVCLVYNYFNFRPLEIIKKYLNEIYNKLKPGGILNLTFNDCDRVSAVKLVEQYYCCYTPGKLMKELALSIGYEITFTWHDDGPTTWLELRKPGVLRSLRGGQTLAKIIPK